MQETIFTQLYNAKEQVAWENELFWAMFDNYPVSPGHTIIIPKKVIISLQELDDSYWSTLKTTISEVIELISNTDWKKIYEKQASQTTDPISKKFCEDALKHPRINTKPDAYNHGVNDGRAAGRTVDHLHWHIIPRYDGDMDDPRGGVRHVIPSKGNYKKL